MPLLGEPRERLEREQQQRGTRGGESRTADTSRAALSGRIFCPGHRGGAKPRSAHFTWRKVACNVGD
jgi:hypothetical protein